MNFSAANFVLLAMGFVLTIQLYLDWNFRFKALLMASSQRISSIFPSLFKFLLTELITGQQVSYAFYQIVGFLAAVSLSKTICYDLFFFLWIEDSQRLMFYLSSSYYLAIRSCLSLSYFFLTKFCCQSTKAWTERFFQEEQLVLGLNEHFIFYRSEYYFVKICSRFYFQKCSLLSFQYFFESCFLFLTLRLRICQMILDWLEDECRMSREDCSPSAGQRQYQSKEGSQFSSPYMPKLTNVIISQKQGIS